MAYRALPPKRMSDAIIPYELIQHTLSPHKKKEYKEPKTTKREFHIGVDIARFGNDRTTIGARMNYEYYEPHEFQGQNLMATVGKINELVFKGKINNQLRTTLIQNQVQDTYSNVRYTKQRLNWMILDLVVG